MTKKKIKTKRKKAMEEKEHGDSIMNADSKYLSTSVEMPGLESLSMDFDP